MDGSFHSGSFVSLALAPEFGLDVFQNSSQNSLLELGQIVFQSSFSSLPSVLLSFLSFFKFSSYLLPFLSSSLPPSFKRLR